MSTKEQTDGIKEICFDVPQFRMETVDFSFDYPRCVKDYKYVLGVKIPYPKCGKHRKVIKFDVPRIDWGATCIKIPFLKDAGEIIEVIAANITALLEMKERAMRDIDEAIDLILANIAVGKKYGKDEAVRELEMELTELRNMRSVTAAEFDKQISELEAQKKAV